MRILNEAKLEVIAFGSSDPVKEGSESCFFVRVQEAVLAEKGWWSGWVRSE